MPPEKPNTDFHALQREFQEQDSAQDLLKDAPQKESKVETDFHVLKAQLSQPSRRWQNRSTTDHLIDFFTPFMILFMVWAVVFFLVSVRTIFSDANAVSVAVLAACVVLGVVGLNRIIARDGADESIIWVAAFGGVVFFGSMAILGDSTAGVSIINNGLVAALFNLVVIGFLWWLTNRLMHECCVDENQVAGDVGILRGTLRSFQRAVKEKPKETSLSRRWNPSNVLEPMEIEAVDPHDWKPPETTTTAPAPSATNKRLAKRHPGVSIFYFSVPVMIIFALGLPVLMQGGNTWIMSGHAYVGVYTLCALSLLMLTSLGGLRQYFRARRVHFPASIGVFWLGFGSIMIAFVMIGALELPQPSMPRMAIVEHEVGPYTRGTVVTIQSTTGTAVERLQQTKFLDVAGKVVLGLFGLFLLYGVLRAVGAVAVSVGRSRRRYPRFIIRIFDRMDALLKKIVRVPSLPTLRARPRIQRSLSAAARIQNPMHGEGAGSGADVRSFVESSYTALCALAYDMGVPRDADQTPYEFIAAFPKTMSGIQEEAQELTELYVRAAYSSEIVQEETLDRLRRFWVAYDRMRERVIR